MNDLISRQAAIDALMEQFKRNTPVAIRAKLTVEGVPSAQLELIAQGAYVRGFEQGMTQGMLDAKLQQTCNQLATDCISRQAAIDMIEKYFNGLPIAVHYDMIAMIHRLPTAQQDPQWIPCSERLPDEDYWSGANHQYSADVLMTVHNADDEETIIDYGHTIDGTWYSDTTDCIVPSEWKVLAWMPLPEPYKGES